ncbi:hypothetical protein [Hymenobacter saemangeumensis]|uniref:hypothetical protein n=1 Tax=Hymenobacter saemangeumensis TaxID=1084522 RepID=UPI0031EC7A4D
MPNCCFFTAPSCWKTLLLWPLLCLLACQSGQEAGEGAAASPPVGHYEGSIQAPALGSLRAALDIRHPSPGHYEAELLVEGAPALSFVGDTIHFANNQLRLTRPGRAGQQLTLQLAGDFWKGSLQLDTLKADALLVKRGTPTPSTYRVEELPQDNGSAWLYSPADTRTPGSAVVLLPDSATTAAGALWGDALAREGITVLVLPAAGAGTTGLGTALRLLRATPGVDTASVGVWAAGRRAAALALELAGPGGPRAAFLVVQQVSLDAESRADFRELAQRRFPVLGLYGAQGANALATPLRAALGGRRATVLAFRDAGPDLLVPGQVVPRFATGLPDAIAEWVRSR